MQQENEGDGRADSNQDVRFFGTADLSRAAGNGAGDARPLFGIRAWR